VKVDHKKIMHSGGNDAKLTTRLSKSSPFEVKMLVEFIRRGISVKDLSLGKISSLPDLYIMVYNADEEVILSSREEAEENNLAQLITIGIPKDLVERHRLLKT